MKTRHYKLHIDGGYEKYQRIYHADFETHSQAKDWADYMLSRFPILGHAHLYVGAVFDDYCTYIEFYHTFD